MEDVEFVWAIGLTIPTALDCSPHYIRGECLCQDFLFVSLVSNRVSLEEVCLPSFDMLNCWLNLVSIFLDDENEIPLKVIALFSASRFALPSVPLIFIHTLVTSLFWSKVST